MSVVSCTDLDYASSVIINFGVGFVIDRKVVSFCHTLSLFPLPTLLSVYHSRCRPPYQRKHVERESIIEHSITMEVQSGKVAKLWQVKPHYGYRMNVSFGYKYFVGIPATNTVERKAD